MNTRILTLFGDKEIIIPEELKVAPKVRGTPANKGKIKDVGLAIEPGSISILSDWVATKQYYTIGEVAVLFNVKTSHIRFWTNEFGLKVRTTRKGDRLYTPALINELRAIYHLIKERGFTLPGAKVKLQTGGISPAVTFDLKESLLKLRNQLSLIRNQLH